MGSASAEDEDHAVGVEQVDAVDAHGPPWAHARRVRWPGPRPARRRRRRAERAEAVRVGALHRARREQEGRARR